MSNQIKFKLATLWIKLGLLVLGGAGVIACLWGLSNSGNPFGESERGLYRVYVNGVYAGTETRVKSEVNTMFVLLLVGGLVLASVIAVLLTRKDLVDFETFYTPLREGSRRRKVTFVLSLVLGWLGIDRLSMGCIMRGLLKFVLGFFTLSLFYLYLSEPNEKGPVLVVAMCILAPMVYWWSVDALLIGMGVAKKRGGVYLT